MGLVGCRFGPPGSAYLNAVFLERGLFCGSVEDEVASILVRWLSWLEAAAVTFPAPPPQVPYMVVPTSTRNSSSFCFSRWWFLILSLSVVDG